MPLEVTNKIVVDWKIEGINELLEKAETADVRHYSDPFDQGRWKLCLQLLTSEKDDCGCFLHCLPTTADWLFASRKERWARSPDYAFSLSAFTKTMEPVGLTRKSLEHSFLASSPSWGWSPWQTRVVLAAPAIKEANSLVVRCEIMPGKPSPALQQPAQPCSVCLVSFNSDEAADVVFTIKSQDSVGTIFASKQVLMSRSSYFRDLFSSNFSESKLKRLAPQDGPRKPSNTLHGDVPDFQAFKELSSTGDEKEPVASGLSPALTPAEEGAPPGSWPEDSRLFREIKVEGSSYATYHALLFFLYTSCISFLPPTSDYLLTHQPPEGESLVPGAWHAPAPVHTDEERDAWLLKNALNRDPAPCSPHAMYRLANRYLLDELKKIAQGYIIRSLTVENVAYEVFCTLSKDYETHQDEVLKFLLKNWDAVKKTRGWAQSMDLLEDGRLPGGTAVLKKIFDALAVKE